MIPGLGADERLFQPYASNFKYTVLGGGFRMTDPFEEYIAELVKEMQTSNPILVGVSFGGLVAQELKKLLPEADVVLVSSFINLGELPFWVRIIPAEQLIGLAGLFHGKIPGFLLGYAFSTSTSEELKLLKSIVTDTPVGYLKWAIANILKWKGTDEKPTIRIHGRVDKIVPYPKDHAVIVLGGGHFMVYQNHREISGVILGLAEK